MMHAVNEMHSKKEIIFKSYNRNEKNNIGLKSKTYLLLTTLPF